MVTCIVVAISIPQSSRQPIQRVLKQNTASGTQPATNGQDDQQSADSETIRSILAAITQIQKQQAEEQNQEASDKQKTINVEWWLVWVSIVQALALIGTIFVLKNTAQRQLRAYVCMTAGMLKFRHANMFDIHIQIKNSGQTPAYKVKQWMRVEIGEYPRKTPIPDPPKNFQMSTGVVAPNEIHDMVRESYRIPAPDEDLGSLQKTVFVSGRVLYVDAFGKNRQTDYRLIYGGPEGGKKQIIDNVWTGFLSSDTEGNEAS